MPEQVESFKQVQDVLDPLGVDKSVKAQAFDAYFDAADEADFKKRFDALAMPREAKGRLWDLRFGGEQQKQRSRAELFTPRGMGELAVREMPAIGGLAGGLAAGVPGAFVGGALGSDVQQMLRKAKGEPAPTTGVGALTEMGVEGAKQAAYEGLGRLPGLALSKTGGAAYKSIVKPSEKLPQATREAVQARGFRLGTEASQKGMAEAQSRIDVNKRVVENLTSPTSLGGQKTIPNRDVLAPLNERIRSAANSNDPSRAQPLLDLKKRWMDKYGDENSFLSVNELQKMKQSSDKEMRDAIFAEGAQPAPKPLGEKLITEGEREEIGKAVPEVHGPNRAIYLDIELKKAINRAVKKDPLWLDHFGRYVLAGGTLGTGTALLTGHSEVAGAEAVGTAVTLMIRRAVQDPKAMTRLAIGLNKAGVTIPKFMEPAVKYGLRFGMPLTPPMPESRLPQDQNAQ